MNHKDLKINMPYKEKTIRIGQKLSRLNTVKGVNSKDNKFSWQTSGSVKPFETGLPLISESSLYKNFVDPVEVEKKMKKFNNEIVEEFEPESVRDIMIDNNEENIDGKKKVSEVSSFKSLYKQICNKKERQSKRVRTGIIKSNKGNNIIDLIGDLSMKSVRGTSKLEDHENPFPVITKRNIEFRETCAQSKQVKNRLKKLIDYGDVTFKECEENYDFPINEIIFDSKEKEIFDEGRNYLKKEEKKDQEETTSLLIDTRNDDIFWTKDNVPFRRKEVEMMKKYREQCKEKSDAHNTKIKRIYDERDKTIAKTFQSKRAFNKALELANKEKDRSIYLPPGKGECHELSWKIAAREANKDNGSLYFRKKSWDRFVKKIIENGPITTEPEKLLIREFRYLLIEGTPVDKECLFSALSVLNKNDFTILKTTVIIEIMRESCFTKTEDLIAWMEERKIPTVIMKLAPESIEREKRTKLRHEREKEEKESYEKLLRGDFPKISIEDGLPIDPKLKFWLYKDNT